MLSNELDIKKEGILYGQGIPIKKEEIFELFKLEKSMCKITFEMLGGGEGKGSGFFCEIDNFPIKYALITNNHVLDEINIEVGKTIHFEYLKFEKSKSLFGSSSKSKVVKKQIKIKDNYLFILHYPNGNDLSFSKYSKLIVFPISIFISSNT